MEMNPLTVMLAYSLMFMSLSNCNQSAITVKKNWVHKKKKKKTNACRNIFTHFSYAIHGQTRTNPKISDKKEMLYLACVYTPKKNP